MPRSRNPEGDFNTRGQDKCPHCSDYFPSSWVVGHVAGCAKNPANAPAPPATNEESS
jgi:hypothetical protein